MHNTKVGVDLAEKVIQVCVFRKKSVNSNKEMSPETFMDCLANSKPMTVVFEACGTSNYWMQKAQEHGHDARLISAKLVETVRQNQKTDKNDALAVIQAAMLPDVNFISGKTPAQQQLQSMQRMRELAIKNRDALKKQLRSLLLELGIRTGNKKGGMLMAIDEVLEDADNGLTVEFRRALHTAREQLSVAIETVKAYESGLESAIKLHHDCKKLLKLESVGPVNAVNLYMTLACNDSEVFSKGKDAAACIGLTPLQHSSGGKTKNGSIGKKVKNSMLRSQLITGAMAVVQQLKKRPAKTEKEVWLKGVIERRGKKRAAVALANKTVRTAFAMLRDGTEYVTKPLVVTA